MRTVLMSVVALVLSLSASCGGSGGGSPSPQGGTDGGESLTPQQRKAALDSLEALVTALPAGAAGNTNRLVQSIRAMPQFADAGSSEDGTVWGLLKNGMIALVVPIAPPDANPSTPTVDAPQSAASPLRARNLGGVPLVTVPASERFRLFNGLGSYFSDTDPRPEIESMLVANGYSGKSEEATLEALRTVKGDGIFYIRTHGGEASVHRDNSTFDFYGLWTSSEVLDPLVEEQDSSLVADLLQNRVVYMLFRNDFWNQPGRPFLEKNRHYGITRKFVAEYMSFADHSLVYVDACNGATFPQFRASFKNASVFVAWDERTTMGAMRDTARYVFDRLLGANRFAPESPKQRPFEYAALKRDPKFGPGKKYGYSTSVEPSDGKTPIIANLDFHPLAGQFGLLAPSLYGVEVDEEKDELVLTGLFGPDPGRDGTVTVGGVALAVSEWSADGLTIKAPLPRSGAGASGNVVVTVRGHHSNTRQLLAWNGTFLYTSQGPGSLTQRFELDLLMRADPHDVRDDPGQPPHPPFVRSFATNLDAAARFEASGTHSYSSDPCTVTVTWTGSGSIPATREITAAQFYVYGGSVDAQRSVVQLGAQAMHAQGASMTQTVACPAPIGTSTTSGPIAVGAATLSFSGTPVLEIPLDDALAFSPGNRQLTSNQTTLSLHWPAVAPQPTYDRELPR